MNKSISQYKRSFVILGTTGNKYTVTITECSNCTCPDFTLNDNFCKHIYFIFLRVLKSKTAKRRNSKNELTKLFLNIPKFIDNDTFLNTKAKNVYRAELLKKRKVIK